MENSAKESPFDKLLDGEQSLFSWIVEHTKNGVLSEFLPDDDSIGTLQPSLQDMRFADGALDGILESSSRKEGTGKALFGLYEDFTKLELSESEFKERLQILLHDIYIFALKHQTLGYIDEFLSCIFGDLENKNTLIADLAMRVSVEFLRKGAHREPVKLALATLGIADLNEAGFEFYKIFGLSDEFAKFVAVALLRNDRNDLIFELTKCVKGWGRIQYLEFIDANSDEIKQWLLFEGYKCELGNYAALPCMEKGDLLGFIKQNGFSEKLYDAVSEMFAELMGEGGPYGLSDYEHYKELLGLFLDKSTLVDMDTQRFSTLCDLFEFINDNYKNEAEKEPLIAKIKQCAATKNWEQIVLKTPFEWSSRKIAQVLNIDLWEKQFELAQKDKKFNQWFVLSVTSDITRFKRLCEFAKTRFDLDALKTTPKDELGLDAKYRVYDDLSCIVQNLDEFDEIIGVEFVETALQSPVTRSRNMALNAICAWGEKFGKVPPNLLKIIKKNLPKEPNADVLKRYEKILKGDFKREIFSISTKEN